MTTSQTQYETVIATTSVTSSSSTSGVRMVLNPGAPVSLVFTSWINIGLALASGGALALGSIILLDSKDLIFRGGRKSVHGMRLQKRSR